MSGTEQATEQATEPSDDVDVLIVGAGLSGVGAACQLRRECPGTTVTLLEARDAVGGTWDLFRYPGVRSDSDMYTLGYSFRPWTGAKALADGTSIGAYIRDAARAYGVDEQVRFGHRVVRADWSSRAGRWTVDAVRTDTGETVTMRCRFLFVCSGYYRYDRGYCPPFPGIDDFAGRVVHPQHWPADLDHAGKRVVVIGSGATAVTLVPALAATAAHVTLLQRSPGYVLSVAARDPLAAPVGRLLPPGVAYSVLRWKSILTSLLVFQLSRRRPALVKRLIRRGVARQLPAGFDVDTHFAPGYDPWDQRLCVVPDGDLFRALSSGAASIVTDRVDRFTPSGLRLASGRELVADVVVTATGLSLLPIGGITLAVDGAQVRLPETVAYKGMMLSGVPNFALTVGYTNASWTLKADLVAGYVCRLLRHLDEHGYQQVTPTAPPAGTPTRPLLDLRSGYVLRSVQALPRQGSAPPWRLHQNYLRDLALFRRAPMEDGVLHFSRAPAAAPVAPVAPASVPAARAAS